MKIITSADMNAELARALGRFSQACNHLEQQVGFIITRLLPLTNEIGRVLFAGNQLRRNLDIMSALTLLSDVPISDATRGKLSAAIPKIRALNDDRSRFLHNTIVSNEGSPPFFLVLDKQDGKNSAAHPISIEMINEKTAEAKSLWAEIFIQPVEYDLSTWGVNFSHYPQKPYPIKPTPKPRQTKAQKQIVRKKSAENKTNPKSQE